MKVSIIGAGISGLSLGCYLQMNGYETEIFEKNTMPGGLCTSWKKGEFTFDGCLHWVLGSDKGSSFYQLWSELLNMKSIEFVNHEVKVAIELKNNSNQYGEKIFQLYTDINRLEAYLLDISPEDKKTIRRWIRLIRVIQQFDMPPMIDSIPRMQSLRRKMNMMTYLPVLIQFLKWKKVTNYTFARGLKSPFLKEAFEMLFDGEEINLLMMTMPLAFHDKKSAGYPIGGSARFALKMAERYESLGGKIHYGKEVRNIIVTENMAKGLMLKDDGPVYSDITVSAADWNFTVFKALEGKYVNNSILELAALRKLDVYPSIFLISLGVGRDFKEHPHFFRFPMKTEYRSPDGTMYNRIEVHIYHYDPYLAPEGKTVIGMSFYTRQGDFWINLRNSDRAEYNRRKGDFAKAIIDMLDEKIGGIKESIEEMDVATPATYHRYTGNWKGSAQGWFPSKNLVASSPVSMELPGLKNFYYTSHWSVPGGGLPMVIKSAHDLVQNLCLRHKIKFVNH
jgi:phytoene dehydrogenase-like protein